MKKVCLPIIILIFSLLISCNREKKGLLWEISGNGLSKSSYLFGTFHQSEKVDVTQFLDSLSGINQYFETVTQFAFETDEETQKNAIASIWGDLYMPHDTTYSDILDQTDLLYLDSILVKHFNGNADKLNVSPNYLLTTLYDVLIAEKIKTEVSKNDNIIMDFYLYEQAIRKGYKTIGLDNKLIREKFYSRMYFGADNKPRTLLESATVLIKTLRILEDTYDEIEVNTFQTENREYVRKLESAYFEDQNLREIEKLTHEFEKARESAISSNTNYAEAGVLNQQNMMNVMGKERNSLWMQKIPALIQEQPTFIAVGVMHLVGEYGLINQLRELGYTVKPRN